MRSYRQRHVRYTTVRTTTTTTTTGVWVRVLRCVASFTFSLADDMMNVERDPACVSASRRRRDRRLRSFWRHECMAVRLALAAAAHHSSLRVSSASTQTEYVAGPAPVTEYVAPAPAVFDAAPAPVTYHEAFPRVVGSPPPGEVFVAPVFNQVHQEPLAAGEIPENIAKIPVVPEQVLVQAVPRFVGSLPPVDEFTACVARRPSPLVEVRPSVRAQRHVVEQLADIAPMVQILDSPEPQMVVQLLEVFRLLDTQLPDEQAISVPTVSCSLCLSRSRVPEPQSADQLVEVPTVLTPARIAVQIAEQIVGTSAPRGRVRGSLPGQSSRGKAGFAGEDPLVVLLLGARLVLLVMMPLVVPHRCHELVSLAWAGSRLMAVMMSGCVWSMWRTTASTSGTGWTTLRAGGCRGESSTAGACSPLASTRML